MSICVVFVHLHFPHKYDKTLKTSRILRVMASFADEGLVTGLSRLATQTTVRLGILWYQIPRYKLLLELFGEKNPRAKSPPLETIMSLGESGFTCVSWSLDWQKEPKIKKMRKKREESRPCPLRLSCLFACEVRRK